MFLSNTGTKIVVAPGLESPVRRASAMAPSTGIAVRSDSGRAGPGWKALPSGWSCQKPHQVHGFSKASHIASASSRVMRSL